MSQSQLLSWCRQSLALAESAGNLLPVSGDASFRQYFRFSLQEQSWIAVHAPPDKENNQAFVDVAKLFADHGLRVPVLLAWDREQGFLLLTDFGDQLLWPLLNTETVDHWYGRSMAAIAQLQAIPLAHATLPYYDSRRLQTEMGLFTEWFVEKLLGCTLSLAEQQRLDTVFSILTQSALSQPQVIVHRDYHSRNLMVLPTQELGLIDFQDAVVGPCTYDLVSLLRDCYIAWPRENVEQWVEKFRNDYWPDEYAATFRRDFDWMGLQRHLKVLGIFARLYLRDGKPNYLNDLPLVLHYTLSVARRYPEFKDFVQWFDAVLMPKIIQQSWYKALEVIV
jgi:aminoglycoside/choline kinase family phosphotransferase